MKQNRKTGKGNPPIFDQFAVTVFNLWAKYGNAKIVFSTNWALSYSDDELKEIMAVNGLDFEYHEDVCTPKRMSSYRHNEILDWLDNHRGEVDKFIAVDDDISCEWIEKILHSPEGRGLKIDAAGEWVQVNFADGMTTANFKQGCDVLGVDMDELREKEYGIKKLTDKEKEERAAALELWAHCAI
jgi:hypothetical protein